MSEPIYSSIASNRNFDTSSAALIGASTRVLGDGTGTGNGIPGGQSGIKRDCGPDFCLDGPSGRLVSAATDFSRQAGVNSPLEYILTTKSNQVPKLVSSAVPYAFLDREPPHAAQAAYHVEHSKPTHYPTAAGARARANAVATARPMNDTRKSAYRQTGHTSIGGAGPVRSFIVENNSGVNAYERAMAQMGQIA